MKDGIIAFVDTEMAPDSCEYFVETLLVCLRVLERMESNPGSERLHLIDQLRQQFEWFAGNGKVFEVMVVCGLGFDASERALQGFQEPAVSLLFLELQLRR